MSVVIFNRLDPQARLSRSHIIVWFLFCSRLVFLALSIGHTLTPEHLLKHNQKIHSALKIYQRERERARTQVGSKQDVDKAYRPGLHHLEIPQRPRGAFESHGTQGSRQNPVVATDSRATHLEDP